MPYTGEKINRPRLIELMDEYDLQIADVAELLNREATTVQTWRARTGVDIPDHSLQLLEYKLAARTPE